MLYILAEIHSTNRNEFVGHDPLVCCHVCCQMFYLKVLHGLVRVLVVCSHNHGHIHEKRPQAADMLSKESYRTHRWKSIKQPYVKRWYVKKSKLLPSTIAKVWITPLNYILVHFTPQTISFGSNYPLLKFVLFISPCIGGVLSWDFTRWYSTSQHMLEKYIIIILSLLWYVRIFSKN